MFEEAVVREFKMFDLITKALLQLGQTLVTSSVRHREHLQPSFVEMFIRSGLRQ